MDAIAIGSDDTIYLLWGSTEDMKNFAPERIYFARSLDDGKTYSPRVDISEAPVGVEHCFPALTVGRSPGDVRLAWMDTRTGAWNVFYRSTSDGGKYFSDVPACWLDSCAKLHTISAAGLSECACAYRSCG